MTAKGHLIMNKVIIQFNIPSMSLMNLISGKIGDTKVVKMQKHKKMETYTKLTKKKIAWVRERYSDTTLDHENC